MTQQEFYNRTGVQPTANEWWYIHDNYLSFNGDKNQFCRAWKHTNARRVRESIEQAKHEAQRQADIRRVLKVFDKLYMLIQSGHGWDTRIVAVTTQPQRWALSRLGVNLKEFCADADGTALVGMVFNSLCEKIGKL